MSVDALRQAKCWTIPRLSIFNKTAGGLVLRRWYLILRCFRPSGHVVPREKVVCLSDKEGSRSDNCRRTGYSLLLILNSVYLKQECRACRSFINYKMDCLHFLCLFLFSIVIMTQLDCLCKLIACITKALGINKLSGQGQIFTIFCYWHCIFVHNKLAKKSTTIFGSTKISWFWNSSNQVHRFIKIT